MQGESDYGSDYEMEDDSDSDGEVVHFTTGKVRPISSISACASHVRL